MTRAARWTPPYWYGKPVDSEPTLPKKSPRRPSSSSARRGSASKSSRAGSGAAKVSAPRPVEAELILLEHPEPPVIVEDKPAAEVSADVETAVEDQVAVEAELAADVDEVFAGIDADAEADVEADVETDIESDTEAEVVEEADAELEDETSADAETAEPSETGLIDVVPAASDLALSVQQLRKAFGGSVAVDDIDLEVQPGSFFGIVGPNGAGKTTTLGMITGLLRPDAGSVRAFGLDVWDNPVLAKRHIGVLPDRLRLFDRLTGAEFLYHAGALRGLDRATISRRSADLSAAFGLEHSLHRLVSDYSAGMTKKIAIAAAMIHAPRLLVLDEPFESVDPVSTSLVLDVLHKFTGAGGTVILSSHSMELTERVCDAIAIIVDGAVLAAGPTADVVDGRSLEERFVELAGGESAVKGMEWLQNFSD